MKKKQNTPNLLGFSNEELAAISKIYEHIETSKMRGSGMATSATELIADLLIYLRRPENVAHCLPWVIQQVKELQKLDRLLTDNEFERLKRCDKIAIAEENYAEKINFMRIGHAAKNRYDALDPEEAALLLAVSQKSLQSLESELKVIVISLQNKMELLELEKLLLEFKLRQITSTIDFKDKN